MVRDLRDRALIATLTYGFARVGADRPTRWRAAADWRRARDTALQFERRLAPCLHAPSADHRIWLSSRSVVTRRREASIWRWWVAAFCVGRGDRGQGTCPVPRPGTHLVLSRLAARPVDQLAVPVGISKTRLSVSPRRSRSVNCPMGNAPTAR